MALANAIAAGQAPTVVDIRRSQAKAAQMRRTVLAPLDLTSAEAGTPAIAPRFVHARPRLQHSESIALVA
ncbi:hypothetical protein WI40_07820 [Burkholderia ubonensis]|nr:hypothetical protein WI40_07820 [Burkholderia ubonensis]